MMALKFWNGHANGWGDRIYVCATSQADASRLINSVFGRNMVTPHELRTYWSAGCWGNQMDGVTPERGLWLSLRHNKRPLRLWVPEIGDK